MCVRYENDSSQTLGGQEGKGGEREGGKWNIYRERYTIRSNVSD